MQLFSRSRSKESFFICNKSFPDKTGKCVFENELLQSHSVIYDQDYQTISKIPLRSSSTSSPLLKEKPGFYLADYLSISLFSPIF